MLLATQELNVAEDKFYCIISVFPLPRLIAVDTLL